MSVHTDVVTTQPIRSTPERLPSASANTRKPIQTANQSSLSAGAESARIQRVGCVDECVVTDIGCILLIGFLAPDTALIGDADAEFRRRVRASVGRNLRADFPRRGEFDQ